MAAKWQQICGGVTDSPTQSLIPMGFLMHGVCSVTTSIVNQSSSKTLPPRALRLLEQQVTQFGHGPQPGLWARSRDPRDEARTGSLPI